MKNSKLNYNIIKTILVASLGLLLILTLFLNVYYIKYLDISEGESGFQFMGFSSQLSSIDNATAVFSSLICLIQLLFGVSCIIYALYVFLNNIKDMKGYNKNINKVYEGLFIGATVIVVMFTIMGLVSKIVICNQFQSLLGSGEYTQTEINTMKSFVHTNTFVSLILVGILDIVYIIIKQLEKNEKEVANKISTEIDDKTQGNNDSSESSKVNFATPNITQNEEKFVQIENIKDDNKNIDLLNKYFELYEKGAITEEEFLEKKKTILN